MAPVPSTTRMQHVKPILASSRHVRGKKRERIRDHKGFRDAQVPPLPALRSLPPQYDVAKNNIGYRTVLSSLAVVLASLLSFSFPASATQLGYGGPDGPGATTPTAAETFELATEMEDKLLGIVRTIETKADTLATTVTSAVVPKSGGGDEAQAAKTEAEIHELIDEVYDVIARNFDDSRRRAFDAEEWKRVRDGVMARNIRDPSVAHSAIREMVLRLKDPYSRFLSPSEFSAMSKYDISGVGLNLGTKSDLEEKTGLVPEFQEGEGAWVIGLIRDSPADYAGVRQGDLILEIAGQGLGQKSPFEVASLFQANDGAEDTDSDGDFPIGIDNEWLGISKVVKKPPIQLRVRHLDGGEEQLDLQRPAVVPTPSPVSTKYDAKKKTAYIKLSSFNARAQRDVSAAVSNLVDAKGAETVVLDLRGNRGGLVSEGIEVAKVFLSKDDIIVRSNIRARQTESVVRADGVPLTDAKLLVLVDGGTASASEIVAGALQDNCRAPLVGAPTYGKGLIQSVYELSDGPGLVLTVGKYLTPLGTDIDYSGLRPDFGGQPDDRQYDERIKACLVRKGKTTNEQ